MMFKPRKTVIKTLFFYVVHEKMKKIPNFGKFPLVIICEKWYHYPAGKLKQGRKCIMGRKISVLLADNSDYFAVPCANVMKSRGLDVTMTEKDGRAVLDALERYHPDVVIMDFFLPRMDAIGVLRNMNSLNLSKRPLVMLMSGFDNPALEKEAMNAGADYYFLKPFDAGEMSERILALCGDAPIAAVTTRKREARGSSLEM
jgi:CheY-like chemotaxis protein